MHLSPVSWVLSGASTCLTEGGESGKGEKKAAARALSHRRNSRRSHSPVRFVAPNKPEDPCPGLAAKLAATDLALANVQKGIQGATAQGLRSAETANNPFSSSQPNDVARVIRGVNLTSSTIGVANTFAGTQVLSSITGSYGAAFSLAGAGVNYMAAYENYNEGNTGLAASQAMQGLGSSAITGGRLLGMGWARIAGVYSAILAVANADVQAFTNIYFGNAEVNSAFRATDALLRIT